MNQFYFSYIASFGAAVITTVVLIWVGLKQPVKLDVGRAAARE